MTITGSDNDIAVLERDYAIAVDAAARGDAEAHTGLPEQRRRLEEARQRAADNAATSADVARAQQRQAAERARQSEAERLRLARERFHQVAAERDSIAIDALHGWLAEGIERVFKPAIEAGAKVDAAAVECGWTGYQQRINTPRDMACEAHDLLLTAFDKLLPGLGMAFAVPGLSGLRVRPLSRRASSAPSMPLAPDRFKRRNFELDVSSIAHGPVEQHDGAVYSTEEA